MHGFLIWIRISPTPYDVFQAYTLTSEFLSDGSCQTVTSAPSVLPTAFVQTAAQSDGFVFFNDEGEQRFLEFLRLSDCIPRGEVVSPTVVAQVQNITVDTTRFRTGGALAPPTRTLGQVRRCLFVGRGAISSSPVERRLGHQDFRAEASMFGGRPQWPWTRTYAVASGTRPHYLIRNQKADLLDRPIPPPSPRTSASPH